MGGLARKATILDQLNEQNIYPLILDAGDLFFKKDKMDPGITIATAKLNAQIIVESFNKMGCDAFSPGANDFAGGLDFLLNLNNKSHFPFVSCNLADKNNNLLFKPYIIKNVKGTNVGIIGLTSELTYSIEGVNVLDPLDQLLSIIDDVDKKSDIIVLLFNSNDKDIKEVYSHNLPLDIILRSRSRTRSNDGGSNIPTYIAGDRGKILYQFDLNLVDRELPFIDLSWCNNTINRIEDRLSKMKKGDLNVDLYSLYKGDQATLNRITNYEMQVDKANQLLENAINTINFKKIELGKTIYDRPDILKIVDNGKLKIKDLTGPPIIGPTILPPN